MLHSKYFLKTQRKPPKGEVSRNAQLLEQGGYTSRLMAGVYTYLPIGWRVLKKIEEIIRSEMNAANGQEVFMPALHPIENYQQTGRDNIDVLFHLKSVSGKNLVLGQSHEEVIVPLVKKYLHSYRDFPLYLYQIQNKFRNELRAKSGLLRAREFIMKDLYSFHTTESDFEKYYEVIKNAYHNIFTRAGIGDITHLTLASGGTFSDFSHEFQTITSSGEDIIHLCKNCKVGVNNDILKEVKSCPECKKGDLEQKKSIEVGNIFPLKTKFSDKFDLTYLDAKGNEKPIIMGCYGIGLGRLMGAIVEIHNDVDGIIWPKTVTPWQVHLLSLGKSTLAAKKVYSTLQKNDFQVLYDDRNETAGIKLKDADLLGISVRLIVSDKTMQKVEIKYRNEKQSRIISASSLINELKKFYS